MICSNVLNQRLIVIGQQIIHNACELASKFNILITFADKNLSNENLDNISEELSGRRTYELPVASV